MAVPAFPQYPTTPRAYARQGARFKVICSSASCTHEGVLTAHELISMGYGDIHMSMIERRLVCTRCKAVRPVVHTINA